MNYPVCEWSKDGTICRLIFKWADDLATYQSAGRLIISMPAAQVAALLENLTNATVEKDEPKP